MNSVEPPLFVRLYRCLTVNFCCKINYTGDPNPNPKSFLPQEM